MSADISMFLAIYINCLLLISSVSRPKSLITCVRLAYLCERRTILHNLHWTLSSALISFLKMGAKPHLLILVLVHIQQCVCYFSHVPGTIPKVALYYTQWFVCFSCCNGNMGLQVELDTDSKPKVWKITNLFQLYTTEDIFSLGWIALMWDGNNFAFRRIKLHLPMILPGFKPANT